MLYPKMLRKMMIVDRKHLRTGLNAGPRGGSQALDLSWQKGSEKGHKGHKKGGGKGKQKGKDNDEQRKEKVVNYKKKADSKINAGRSTCTDARYWSRIIQDDMARKDVEQRKASL